MQDNRLSAVMPHVSRVRVIDFETYYAKDFTLSKLTPEEYIRDSRFETIGFAYQDLRVDGTPIMAEPKWVTGDETHLQDYIRNGMNWDGVCVVAHNTGFDGPILSWRYGVNPAQWSDTLDLARPRYGFTVGGSLKATAEALGVGVKGTEVENAIGKRRQDFSPEEMYRYAEYCKNDVALTSEIFKRLADGFPQSEAYTIDLLIRMKTNPVLEIDVPMLEQELAEYQQNKQEILRHALKVGMVNSDKIRKRIVALVEKGEKPSKLLSSNPMFAEMLRVLGYEPPMKVSPTTGKQTYAFGKKDPEFMAFEEDVADDPTVVTLIAARKKTKSTIFESRMERFIAMGKRGPLPVPLRYYGAHTGRASGADKLNFQNMPKKSNIRKAVMAPDGHTLVVADSGQIEARGVGWVANELGLLQQFANGEDVYRVMASKIYDVPVAEVSKTQRQLGKIAVLGLGYGMGASKFADTVHSWGEPKPSDILARRAVEVYRTTNPNIPELWTKCDRAIKHVAAGGTVNLGPSEACPLTFFPKDDEDSARILLPNGMYLRYAGLQWSSEDNSWVYFVRRGRNMIKKFLWGGTLTENIVQALARIVVFDQMNAIDMKLRAASAKYGGVWQTTLTVHDEVVLCVPEDKGGAVLDLALKAMKTPPAWAQGWPLDAEGDVAKRYGDAK